MNIDITKFFKNNVIDTCSIWNVLSSTIFFNTTISQVKLFAITEYVLYESLYKPRKDLTEQEVLLINKFKKEIEKKSFTAYPISIEDLQEVYILENRKRMGRGELSSMIFAKKTNISFITDDQKARKFAGDYLAQDKIQTVPHLLGWLFFNSYLLDSDLELIIKEHNSCDRSLEKYFREVYFEALRCKLMLQQQTN